jgi:hypothetical protein
MKGKYLITTDSWFYAPDGRVYRAVWGEVEIMEDTFLGVKTNRNSANWYAKVGADDKCVVIAGCQIHYAVRCQEKPSSDNVIDYLTSAENGLKEFVRPTQIWIAE